MIAKKELKHGAYYTGRCRNATVARWNAERQRFVIIRHEFGKTFPEEICHPDDERRYDMFVAESEAGEPAEPIPLTIDP